MRLPAVKHLFRRLSPLSLLLGRTDQNLVDIDVLRLCDRAHDGVSDVLARE